MSGQFQVSPSSLTAGASAFESHYQALCSAIKNFEANALDMSGAFGFLGPSVSVLETYEDSTEKAFQTLDKLASLLLDASKGLTTTAANYTEADSSSTQKAR